VNSPIGNGGNTLLCSTEHVLMVTNSFWAWFSN